MNDGVYTYYLIQHSYLEPQDGAWVQSDVGHFLFEGMPFAERKGRLAMTYRALLEPTHECWQHTGVHGFLNFRDAVLVLNALRELPPRLRRLPLFRVVRRTVVQRTAVVAGGCAAGHAAAGSAGMTLPDTGAWERHGDYDG